jgi:hypothetical protein
MVKRGVSCEGFSCVLLLETQYAREGEPIRRHERVMQDYSGRTTYSPMHHEPKSQTAVASDSVRADLAEPSAPVKIPNSIHLDDN